MATVTGFTAARMLEIENSTVVDGDVVDGDLILKTRDNTEINAGSVIGPQGPVGPAGPNVPPATVAMFAGTVAPAGYLMCDGGVVSRTTYAALFAVIGTSYGAGDGSTTFALPDMQSRFPVGKGPAAWSDSLNEKGGSKDLIVVAHKHVGPAHQHANPAHAHSLAAGSATLGGGTQVDLRNMAVPSERLYKYAVLHNYNFSTGSSGIAIANSDTGNTDFGGKWAITIPNHNHSLAGTTSNDGATTSGTAGASDTTEVGSPGTDQNLPPYITMNFIIKT